MKYEMLKTAAEAITIPEEMKCRIAEHCRTQVSDTRKERTMKYNTVFKKRTVILVALALCLALSVTVLGVTGVLDGFFRDITDFRGAIVGTSYEQATDEIDVKVAVNGDVLTVLAVFVDPQMVPYREAELLRIAEYKIVNTDGKVVKEGTETDASEVIDGQVTVAIPLTDLADGDYTLIVSGFVTEKKADQPLPLNGSWICTFTK